MARLAGDKVATILPPTYIGAMLRRVIAFLALLAMGSLDAVAAVAGAPSLARRPAELRDQAPPPASPAPAPAPADPAFGGRVQQLLASAQKADASFGAAYAGESSRVATARGAAVSSEAWVVGQNAISRLDSLRYESVAALATLDSLRAERLRGGAAADVALLDPAQARLLAMVDGQNDRLDQLKAQLTVP